METKGKIKIDKTDRDWPSSSLAKKEQILFIIYIFASLSILFFTAWLLRSMPNDMMKVVLISMPLLVGMLIGVIILSFGGVKQNGN